MSKEINLLPKKKTNEGRKKKITFIFRASSIFLLIVISFTAIILFFLQSQSAIPSLVAEEKLLLAELSSLHGKTAKYLLTNERLKNISIITKQRYPMNKFFTTVTNQLPDAVMLNGFSVEKNTLVISASAPSLSVLNIFIDNMTKLVKEKKFLKRLTLDSLGYDYKTAKYSLSMEAELL